MSGFFLFVVTSIIVTAVLVRGCLMLADGLVSVILGE